MKYISIFLNIVLLAAVAVLYYLHFTPKPEAEQNNYVANTSNLQIAYVKSDSLLDQYTFFINKKKSFEEKQNGIKAELTAENTKLQREIEEYQKQAAYMSDQDRGRREEELALKQQKLIQKKDDMLSNLDDEQDRYNEDLYNRLSAYMKEFNKTRNYSYILGIQRGGGILYANDSLNITREVVEGLNREYEQEEKKKK